MKSRVQKCRPLAILEKGDFTGTALQRQNSEISKQLFPEKEYWGLSPNLNIHAPVRDLYSDDRSAYSAGGNM